MNDLIEKNKLVFPLDIIEYGGIRVLTTKQLAEVYGTEPKVISKNFNRNKDEYIEDKHYILLDGKELIRFKKKYNLPRNLNKLYLWTEKGTLLHTKSLNVHKACTIYERLVKYYFEEDDKMDDQKKGQYRCSRNDKNNI